MKFEYGDFYKFIASLGIALISLAILAPWLFLREPFDLFLSSDELLELTPLAQSIIEQRQLLMVVIIRIIPWFSVIVFGLGLIIFILGGSLWLNRTQKQIDKLNELNIKVLEQQLPRKTPEESKIEKEEEIKAMLDDERVAVAEVEDVLQPDEISSAISTAYRIEKMVSDRLRDCLKDSHKVLVERRLGKASFDIILLAKSEKFYDYTIELKYIRQGFKYNWLRDNVQKIILANQIYLNELGRKSIPVLLVVVPKTMSNSAREMYMQRLERDISDISESSLAILQTETELFGLSCSDLKNIFAKTIL